MRTLTAKVGGVPHVAEVNVTGLAGFLLAKCAAAHSRRKRKDWYDIAFVLLHNDQGGSDAAINRVLGDKPDSMATTQPMPPAQPLATGEALSEKAKSGLSSLLASLKKLN